MEELGQDTCWQLLREAEGILAWAVEGAKCWYESGLEKPHEVEAAKDKWREDMDQFGRFVEERCYVAETFSTRASALYERCTNRVVLRRFWRSRRF